MTTYSDEEIRDDRDSHLGKLPVNRTTYSARAYTVSYFKCSSHRQIAKC
jgi:hypothetical protein